MHALTGLSELNEQLTEKFHSYFLAIEALTTIRIPRNAEDFERYSTGSANQLREPRALYVVSR